MNRPPVLCVIAFVVALATFWSDMSTHDERGAIIQQITPQGDLPELAAGENPVSLTGTGPAEYNTRVQVTVITQGQPLGD